MNKTLLLLSLISGLSMAATTGTFEVVSNAGNKVYSEYKAADTEFDVEAKGEIKVTGTGFSTGGNFKYNIVKDQKIVGDKTKFWAKYEFPRFYGVGTSLKSTLYHDLKTEVEGNINGNVAKTDLYATVTYKGTKLVEKPGVEAELGATYKGLKDTELGAKAFGEYSTDKWSAGSELNAKYTGVKDVELAAMLKGKYESNKEKKIIIEAKPSVSYKGVKNTTISASVENKVELKHNGSVTFADYTAKPEISASYKYEVTEELTLMPKIKVGTELKYTDLKPVQPNQNSNAKVYATPELGLTYKPISGLTLSAKAELPIELKAKKVMSAKDDVTVKAKGQVSVKYEW